MKSCLAAALTLVVALFSACAASTDPTSPVGTMARAETMPRAGIECPLCFTIIEHMRSSARQPAHEPVTLQCERCCETLRFRTDAQGQLWVATRANPEPLPCDVCAPAPPR